ncbi:hypothetical protein B5F07_14960 [Lachnoclostridium sp. An169]|nr:hypothetical protein B5F07_14960 [Lachnoclostridium sp. An169]
MEVCSSTQERRRDGSAVSPDKNNRKATRLPLRKSLVSAVSCSRYLIFNISGFNISQEKGKNNL